MTTKTTEQNVLSRGQKAANTIHIRKLIASLEKAHKEEDDVYYGNLITYLYGAGIISAKERDALNEEGGTADSSLIVMKVKKIINDAGYIVTGMNVSKLMISIHDAKNNQTGENTMTKTTKATKAVSTVKGKSSSKSVASSYKYTKSTYQSTQDILMPTAVVAVPENYTGFKKELLELLLIQAPSGKEEKVREYLIPILDSGLVDSFEVDKAGNLLGTKKCGTGEGATVMLSAHMDSVSNVKKDRVLMESNGMFFSTKGVLGADDRAGIAVVLGALRQVESTGFNGTIKVAFPVSEEIGCVGSSAMDVAWYEDVDLAIVIDRRGSRDIVTGCSTPWNFCSKEVGAFFEECSAMLDMDYKSCGGGVSDAMTFSSNGVHSVNLSAGYYNEHSSDEYVVIEQTQDTLKLVVQALAVINSFYQGFGEVPVGYTRSSYYGSSYSSTNNWADEDFWGEYDGNGRRYIDRPIYSDGRSQGGLKLMEVTTGYLEMTQSAYGSYGAQSIWVEQGKFEEMIDSYLKDQDLPGMAVIKAAAKERKEKLAKEAKGVTLEKGVNRHFVEEADGNLVKIK